MKTTDRYCLLTLVGRNQLAMLRASLISVQKNFKQLPAIYIITDGSVTKTMSENISSWLYAEDRVKVISAQQCLNYHQERGNSHLHVFATANPMGLKLAAIVQLLSLKKPLLYFDTDVLWHGDPLDHIRMRLTDQDFCIALSADFQAAYDWDMVKRAGLELLQEAPFYCAGIILINHLSEKMNYEMKRLTAVAAMASDHFTEQTILAYIAKISGSFPLDKSSFLIQTNDQYRLVPDVPRGVIARHYIGPVRHLFWRDAIWLN